MTHISSVHFEKYYDFVKSAVKCSLKVLDGEPQLSEKIGRETEIEKLVMDRGERYTAGLKMIFRKGKTGYKQRERQDLRCIPFLGYVAGVVWSSQGKSISVN